MNTLTPEGGGLQGRRSVWLDVTLVDELDDVLRGGTGKEDFGDAGFF